MLIGSFGRFWDREQVDWSSDQWRLLGRQGKYKAKIKVANFRFGRGVYILYNEMGVYDVGWFSFDAPGADADSDHVVKIDREDYSFEELESRVAIRDLEALLQIAMQPFANKSETTFADGGEWTQVATRTPDVLEFSVLPNRLSP